MSAHSLYASKDRRVCWFDSLPNHNSGPQRTLFLPTSGENFNCVKHPHFYLSRFEICCRYSWSCEIDIFQVQHINCASIWMTYLQIWSRHPVKEVKQLLSECLFLHFLFYFANLVNNTWGAACQRQKCYGSASLHHLCNRYQCVVMGLHHTACNIKHFKTQMWWCCVVWCRSTKAGWKQTLVRSLFASLCVKSQGNTPFCTGMWHNMILFWFFPFSWKSLLAESYSHRVRFTYRPLVIVITVEDLATHSRKSKARSIRSQMSQVIRKMTLFSVW